MKYHIVTINKASNPITFGDLNIGDVFFVGTSYEKDAYIKIEAMSYLKEYIKINAISLESGKPHEFFDDREVEKYTGTVTFDSNQIQKYKE